MKQYDSPPLMTIDPSANYTATIRTNQGPITVDLFASQAPKTVNSFVFLAREGFYNGIIFHRVIQGFMIQGGDPTGTGTAGRGCPFCRGLKVSATNSLASLHAEIAAQWHPAMNGSPIHCHSAVWSGPPRALRSYQ